MIWNKVIILIQLIIKYKLKLKHQLRKFRFIERITKLLKLLWIMNRLFPFWKTNNEINLKIFDFYKLNISKIYKKSN